MVSSVIVLVFGLIGLLLGLLLAAAILRAAIAAFNKFADPQQAVDEPSTPKAMGILIVACGVSAAVNFGINMITGMSAFHSGMGRDEMIFLFVRGISIGFLIQSGFLAVLLPVSFSKALLISLLNMVISLLVAAFLGGLIYMISKPEMGMY